MTSSQKREARNSRGEGTGIWWNVIPWAIVLILSASFLLTVWFPRIFFYQTLENQEIEGVVKAELALHNVVNATLEHLDTMAEFPNDDLSLRAALVSAEKKGEYRALSARFAEFQQAGGLSFMELSDLKGDVLASYGLRRSRWKQNISQWSPYAAADSVAGWRGISSIDNDIYAIKIFPLVNDSERRGNLIIGIAIDSDLIFEWSRRINADLLLERNGNIVSSTLTAPIPANFSLPVASQGALTIGSEKFAYSKYPLLENNGQRLAQIHVLSSMASLSRAYEALTRQTLTIIFPLTMAAIGLVFVIAFYQARLNRSLQNANGRLREASQRTVRVLEGTRAMSSTPDRRQVCRVALEWILQEITLPRDLDITLWLTENGGENIRFIKIDLHRNPNIPMEVEAVSEAMFAEPPFSFPSETVAESNRLPYEIKERCITLSIPGREKHGMALITVEGSFTAEEVLPHKEFLESIATSLSSLLASLELLESEQTALRNAVSLAAQVSDALNSPLLVVLNIIDSFRKQFTQMTCNEENAASLVVLWQKKGPLLDRSLADLNSVVKRLSELREQGRNMETTAFLGEKSPSLKTMA